MYDARLVPSVGDWSRSVRTNTSVREGKMITERARDDTVVRAGVSRELEQLSIQ